MGVNYSRNLLEDQIENKPRLSLWISWPAVIIFFIIFWPVGVVLLCKRSASKSKSGTFSGRVVQFIGWLFIVFATILAFGSGSEGVTGAEVTLIIFFLTGGLVIIPLGSKISANAVIFKMYNNIIENQNLYSIDSIARVTGLPVKRVMSDLQKMIDKGYFTGAHIDEVNNEFIIPGYNDSQKQENSTVNNTDMIIVICKSCGASNTIINGTVGKCEYCGSPIA